MQKFLSAALCLFLFSASAFFSGCSNSNLSSPPQFVDVQSVRSLVIAKNISDLEVCENEVRASGATILYKNSLGVLMTDGPASGLALSQCQATVADNAPVNIPHTASTDKVASPPADLNTLLRLIPAEEIGARSFVKAHPNYDGRGVVIAILDTGIELDHPVLSKTPSGEVKTLDFQDFSGEGRVALLPTTRDSDGSITGPSGKFMAKTIAGSDFRLGQFNGSSLSYASDLTAADTFVDVGVLVYKNTSGEWRARIDTNHDGNFDDETEVYDFNRSRLFTKLGKKKSLTVSVTLAPDGNTATLNFDDGSHGTHVAGIAAGYDPQGLEGVAPGAQIVLGKIGDGRLSGGSTTTASMVLAIDFAVESKAQIVNLSYGIRPGSNLGKSAIDDYVNRVAAEKGILFSISAGNEGPGLLTVGVPAGADLAITNAAYLSRQTAAENYGWVGLEQDGTWFFSSVGPRLDGGWKPTLLSPGTALSSVPNWTGKFANYSGTSMASPETTGGLALILSAAKQAGLLTDRASVTRAVYDSAKRLPDISLIEQGHGLFNVPQAYDALTKTKTPPMEFAINATNPVSPTGTGGGIFVKASSMPENIFNVQVSPVINGSTSAGDLPLRTMKLVPSASWIHCPSDLWIQTVPRSFQVQLDRSILSQPGLHSEVITAVDENSGQTAFEVPVTVVSPIPLNEANQHLFSATETAPVGRTLRYFLDIPAGTTALTMDLSSDGPAVWAQLLDPEGQTAATLKDSEGTSPLPPLFGQVNVNRAGVYELDVVSPPNLPKSAQIQLRVRGYSLALTLGTPEVPGKFTAYLQNNYEPLKLIPSLRLDQVVSSRVVSVTGSQTTFPIGLTEDDRKMFSKITLDFSTARRFYDLMTDYPYRVLDSEKSVVSSGGLELNTSVDLTKLSRLPKGDLNVEVSGSFATGAPESWSFTVRESRGLANPVAISTLSRMLLENGQQKRIPVNLTSIQAPVLQGYDNCATLSLSDPNGRLIQSAPLCR